MPLYEYVCNLCQYEFEELITGKETVTCKKCGGPVEQKMSSFSSVIEGGSDNESVDMKIGREAEHRWKMHHDIQSKRRKDKKLELLKVPKTKKGQFMPAMALGNKEDKKKRKEYSSALKEHRKERISKGQPQFTGAGSF